MVQAQRGCLNFEKSSLLISEDVLLRDKRSKASDTVCPFHKTLKALNIDNM